MLIRFLFLAFASSLFGAEITLTSPIDHQVIQRHSNTEGTVLIRGTQSGLDAGKAKFEAKIGAKGRWQALSAQIEKEQFSASVTAPAGGWHRVEVRAMLGGKTVATSSVEHVGIGEVFVVAGQSNSANHGEEKQTTQTQRVAAFDGTKWQLADDPQPGASGRMGSFMPALGDALVKRFDVPVGFVACGIGATSVREWLPKGTTFPNPPTIESRVMKLPDGQWASNGAAYDAFIARMRPLGHNGFRAVLWHQGESDANQKDKTRTLAGKLYREYLEKIIHDSRRDTGFDAPWFVAQASYHVPSDEGSDDIRAAQASLWKDGLAQPGPDSDALKGPLRERKGLGVHFSGAGLRAHGQKWAEKITPWLQQRLADDSFTPLFNGKDLTGWDGDPKLWKVENGIVIGTNPTPEAMANNSFLIWRGGTVKDFELHATVRVIGDNNSGVQYRSRELPEVAPWVITGYQCDIHPAIEHTGMTYEEKGRGIFGLNGKNVMLDPDGALWLLSEHAPVKVDVSQWNEYGIIAKGNRLTHQINGQPTSALIDHDEKKRALEGLLAIQLHRGNPNRVEIKDLRLKVLPEAPLVPFDAAKLSTATKIEKPRTSRPQGTGPVVPTKK